MSTDEQYKFPKRIARVVDSSITLICKALAGAIVFVMTILITIDVLGRYFFGMPTMVAVEISGYLLVGLVYLGLVYTASVDRNIVIEIFISRLGHVRRKQLENIVLFVSVVFSAWLVWFTLGPVIMDFSLGTKSLTGTNIPIWLPSALIPVGFGLLTVNLLAKFVLGLGTENRQGSSDE